MIEKNALVFGYNEYALEIEKNISSKYEHLFMFRYAEDGFVEHAHGSELLTFDLSDNWDELRKIVNIKESIAFCVLEDSASNMFLTISLREVFGDLKIVALAADKESADKLMLCGASLVIPSAQTTANIIVEMLAKPRVREVLHEILYETSELRVAKVEVSNSAIFGSVSPLEIDWKGEFGVALLFVEHENLQSHFIYSSQIKERALKSGDSLVVVGYESDIERFTEIAEVEI